MRPRTSAGDWGKADDGGNDDNDDNDDDKDGVGEHAGFVMNRGGGGRLRDSNRRDMATSSSGVHSAVIGWREDRRPHHRHLTRAHVRPELSGSRSLLCLL
ncbi:hypothetical protein Q1695_000778 [Nippostrongylus brasiliensis]|nr:hypothetical protein Q1695_000778 [Nippostrongylus brasiliensis]